MTALLKTLKAKAARALKGEEVQLDQSDWAGILDLVREFETHDALIEALVAMADQIREQAESIRRSQPRARKGSSR